MQRRTRHVLVIGLVGVLATGLGVVTWLRHGERVAPAPPPAASQASPAPPPTKTPLPASPSPTVVPPAPRRVVIISEDGMRPDALSPELTPRHIELMHEGATAKVAETIPESDTLPSHASMLSGVGAQAHGLWWNSYQATRGHIHVPTVFSAAHERGLRTAMIVGKPKLLHIASPGTVDHFERPSYLCAGVARAAAEYFTAQQPDLLFVHFSDPDEYGHSDGWMSPKYQAAVHAADSCLATVLDAIDASSVGSTTLVIVTADHGGHGKRHSDGREAVDREIPWIVRGPGIPRDTLLEGTVETVDTAATTLAALGLPALPHMNGSTRFKFPPRL
jgi:arylsulfatase A-like enzyme